jgi:Uncharacterized conserved protein
MNKMVPANIEKYSPEYSENKFWNKVKKYSRRIGATCVKQALYLYFIMIDKSTPTSLKLQIAGALGYLILPLDMIPDFIPFAGFTDDISAIVYVYNKVKNHITPEIEAKVEDKIKAIFN